MMLSFEGVSYLDPDNKIDQIADICVCMSNAKFTITSAKTRLTIIQKFINCHYEFEDLKVLIK